jgi:hypothetical protein
MTILAVFHQKYKVLSYNQYIQDIKYFEQKLAHRALANTYTGLRNKI